MKRPLSDDLPQKARFSVAIGNSYALLINFGHNVSCSRQSLIEAFTTASEIYRTLQSYSKEKPLIEELIKTHEKLHTNEIVIKKLKNRLDELNEISGSEISGSDRRRPSYSGYVDSSKTCLSTSLDDAVINCSLSGVKYFLHRIEMDSGSKDLITGMHLAVTNGHSGILELLIDKGVDINALDDGGNTAIHLAAINGHSGILELLIDKGVDVNALDDGGNAAIHLAAINGHSGILELLIDKGVDINALNKNGDTPFNLVTKVIQMDIVELLVDKGVDINAPSKDGEMPISSVIKNDRLSFAREFSKYSQDLVRLFMEKGADLSSYDSDGNAPIHLASSSGYHDIVSLLIDQGIDVDFCNAKGSTSLHLAAISDSATVAELLIDRGADVNACDRDKNTPLHLTAMYNSSNVLKVLRRKDSINFSDSFSQEFMELAVVNDSDRVVKLLNLSEEEKGRLYHFALEKESLRSANILSPKSKLFNNDNANVLANCTTENSQQTDNGCFEMSICELDKEMEEWARNDYKKFKEAVCSKNIKAVKCLWEIAEKLEKSRYPGTKLNMFLAGHFALVESAIQNPCSEVLEYLQEIGRPLFSTVLQGFERLGVNVETSSARKDSSRDREESEGKVGTFMFPSFPSTEVEIKNITFEQSVGTSEFKVRVPGMLPGSASPRGNACLGTALSSCDETISKLFKLPFLMHNNPSNDKCSNNHLINLCNMAVQHVEESKYGEALASFQTVFDKRKSFGYKNFDTVMAGHNLALVFYVLNRPEKALEVLGEMLTGLGNDSNYTGVITNNINIISNSLNEQNISKEGGIAKYYLSSDQGESTPGFNQCTVKAQEVKNEGGSTHPSTSMDNLQTEKHTSSSRRIEKGGR